MSVRLTTQEIDAAIGRWQEHLEISQPEFQRRGTIQVVDALKAMKTRGVWKPKGSLGQTGLEEQARPQTA